MKRTYNQHGDLIAYEVTKEMRTRGRRLWLREQIKDIAIRFAIVSLVAIILAVVYLIATN